MAHPQTQGPLAQGFHGPQQGASMGHPSQGAPRSSLHQAQGQFGQPMPNGLAGHQRLFAQHGQLGPSGQRITGTKYKDLTSKNLLTEAGCRTALTTRQVWTLRKQPILDHTKKSSWQHVESTLEPWSEEEIMQRVIKLGRSSRPVIQKKDALGDTKARAVSAQMEDLAREEFDPSFEWILEQLDFKKTEPKESRTALRSFVFGRPSRKSTRSKEGKHSRFRSITMFVRRQPKPHVNCIELKQLIEQDELWAQQMPQFPANPQHGKPLQYGHQASGTGASTAGPQSQQGPPKSVPQNQQQSQQPQKQSQQPAQQPTQPQKASAQPEKQPQKPQQQSQQHPQQPLQPQKLPQQPVQPVQQAHPSQKQPQQPAQQYQHPPTQPFQNPQQQYQQPPPQQFQNPQQQYQQPPPQQPQQYQQAGPRQPGPQQPGPQQPGPHQPGFQGISGGVSDQRPKSPAWASYQAGPRKGGQRAAGRSDQYDSDGWSNRSSDGFSDSSRSRDSNTSWSSVSCDSRSRPRSRPLHSPQNRGRSRSASRPSANAPFSSGRARDQSRGPPQATPLQPPRAAFEALPVRAAGWPDAPPGTQKYSELHVNRSARPVHVHFDKRYRRAAPVPRAAAPAHFPPNHAAGFPRGMAPVDGDNSDNSSEDDGSEYDEDDEASLAGSFQPGDFRRAAEFTRQAMNSGPRR